MNNKSEDGCYKIVTTLKELKNVGFIGNIQKDT